MAEDGAVVIPKVWRSEYKLTILFFVTCFLSVFLTKKFPALILVGPLFSLGTLSFSLKFPLLGIIPAFFLGLALFRIYNVRYVLDGRGIRAYEWVLGPQRITTVRYEDIRSIETEQSIIGRILDIGDLEIGTAAQSSVEVVFRGIGTPHEVLRLVQRERDKRHERENTP